MMNLPPPDMPAFCIVDLQPISDVGRYDLHIRSWWNDDGPTRSVSSETVEYVVARMPFCPPGYPNPPVYE
jgi:hypothetical protein